ncbi:unnamed protein product, partial [Phaeothamnion confervicola]
SPPPNSASRSDQREQGSAAIGEKLQQQCIWLRRKLHTSQEELSRVKRALAKEVGDTGGNCGGAGPLQEGWKGRAQQIALLRARVRDLEARQATHDEAAAGKTGSSADGTGGCRDRIVAEPAEPRRARAAAQLEAEQKAVSWLRL